MDRSAPYKWFFETTTPVEGHFHAITRTLFSLATPFQQMEIMETASYGKCLVLDGRIQRVNRALHGLFSPEKVERALTASLKPGMSRAEVKQLGGAWVHKFEAEQSRACREEIRVPDDVEGREAEFPPALPEREREVGADAGRLTQGQRKRSAHLYSIIACLRISSRYFLDSAS